MQIAYNIITGFAVFVGVVFTFLVLITGKGDAMSGGASGVRTTFKGKASFEDKMFYMIMYLGAGFLVMMIVLNILAKRIWPTV